MLVYNGAMASMDAFAFTKLRVNLTAEMANCAKDSFAVADPERWRKIEQIETTWFYIDSMTFVYI